MEGNMEQLDLFSLDTKYMDVHIDRAGKEHKPPKWMHYERCENCTRWQRLDVSEQPPCGWGIYGFCLEHKQRTGEISYCGKWEDKRRIQSEQ